MSIRSTMSIPIDRALFLVALVLASVLALIAIAVSPAASLAQERDAITGTATTATTRTPTALFTMIGDWPSGDSPRGCAAAHD